MKFILDLRILLNSINQFPERVFTFVICMKWVEILSERVFTISYFLFVSRVRLMERLFPDGRVRISSPPHGLDLPLQTPLWGLGLGGETLMQ